MNITRSVHDTDVVLTFDGVIAADEANPLALRLLEELGIPGRDLVLDVRTVTAFDDAALVALTVARSRAKFVRRRIVVVDHEDGVVTASLRRSGMNARLPIYPDVPTAMEGLTADREALARRRVFATT